MGLLRFILTAKWCTNMSNWLTDPDTTDEQLEEAAEIARQTQRDIARMQEEMDELSEEDDDGQ